MSPLGHNSLKYTLLNVIPPALSLKAWAHIQEATASDVSRFKEKGAFPKVFLVSFL